MTGTQGDGPLPRPSELVKEIYVHRHCWPMAGAESELFLDFSIVLVVAALTILLFHRLRQPIILGYILAGILIGPYVTITPTIQNISVIEALADLAIVFIMFSLGLSFSFSKLRSVGLVASVTGTIEIVSMVMVGYTLGLAFGWSDVDAFFLGAMIAISSTAVITKGILDSGSRGERSSQIVTGILIVEDLAVVVILTLITGISATGELQLEGLLMTLINIGLFIVLFLGFGFVIAPRFAKYADETGSRELILMTALGLCFCFALLGFVLGFSSAIGAFVAGAVLGELPQRERIATEVRPVRDVFAAVFFITIGMLLDPQYVLDYWLPILVVATVFIAAKMGLLTFGTFLFGVSAKTALQVGLTMVVMGEFSYIIAREGMASGVISDFIYPTVVTASVLTIVVGAQLTMNQEKVLDNIGRRTPQSVKRYTAFLTLTLNQLRSQASLSGRISAAMREHVREILLDSVLILCAALGMRLGLAFSSDILAALGVTDELLTVFEMALVLVTLVIIITAFIALMRSAFKLVGEASLPLVSPEGGKRPLKQTVTYQSLKAMIFLSVLVGGTLVVTFIGTPLAPSPSYLLILVVVAVVAAYVFERSVVSFNERFKLTFREGLKVKEDAELPELPAKVPVDLHVPEILGDADRMCYLAVEQGTPYSGMALGETDVRTRDDVAVLGIRRDDGLIIDPDDEERLRDGDVLIYIEGCVRRG